MAIQNWINLALLLLAYFGWLNGFAWSSAATGVLLGYSAHILIAKLSKENK